MGAVYKARDNHLDRFAAIKVLPAGKVADPRRKARFVREAKAASALSHSNIVTIYDISSDAGVDFIAMEYVAGKTLDRIIPPKGMPVEEALKIAAQIADALARAHAAGIVHRDLKPSNIMVDEHGLVKLVDFGLAKLIEQYGSKGDGGSAESARTEEWTILGTAAYMSPEQAQGKPVDARSDIFSFGAVLYELLSGRRPFQAATAGATLAAVITLEPPPLKEAPPELARIVGKLLEKNRDRRYQSMEEVSRDLQAVRRPLQRDAPPATTISLRESPWRRFTRRKLAIAAAALAVALSASGWNAARSWLRARALPDRVHLAVLPFQAGSADEALRAYADGLTVFATRGLARSPGIMVVTPADSRRLESAAQARDEFGANLVLTGRVEDLGESRKVLLRLAGAGTPREFGSAYIIRPRSELHLIQAEVLARAAGLLRVSLPAEPQAAVQTRISHVPAAQAAFMLADGYLYRYDRADSLERARLHFDQAIRLDPKFAAAFVGLAEAHLRDYGNRREPGILQSALLAARRAVELEPDNADAHRLLGAVFNASRQPELAVQELETALKLDPGNHSAYLELGRLYESQRRFAEAERTYQQAIRAFPGDWRCRLELAGFYFNRQREADAERLYREALQTAPDNSIIYRNLGAALSRLGRNEEAIQRLRESLSLGDGARAYSNLGAVLMFEGRYAEALDAMEKAAAIATRDGLKSYRLWGNLGDAYWLTKGSPEKMQGAWRRAIQTGEQQLRGVPADAELLAILGKYHAKLGSRRESERRLAQALQYAPDSAAVHYQASLAWALLGERTRCMAELAEAVRLGYSTAEIRKAPELEPVRADPKFEDILKRSGGR